mmetsp:Transcript_26930/g.50308  ORF Transcript_26930/g.50308 Transcript_26930/m.50308 type:complete len:251 (-) Transcript_26930:129-881(-)
MMDDLLPPILKMLHGDGWDVVGLGSTDAYNDLVIADGKQEVLSSFPPNHLVLCVGHSKSKWKDAQALLGANVSDPFDHMSKKTGVAIREYCRERAVECLDFYSHCSDPFLVSFQRLAVATGTGVFHEESHMVLHHRFGPWVALRLALVLPCPVLSGSGGGSCEGGELQAWIRAAKTDYDAWVVNHSTDFLLEEESARAAEVVQRGLEGGSDVAAVFLQARKSFSTGKASMYDDEQMLFHYGAECCRLASS